MQYYVPLNVPSMVVSGIDIHSNLTISTGSLPACMNLGHVLVVVIIE